MGINKNVKSKEVLGSVVIEHFILLQVARIKAGEIILGALGLLE